MAMMERRVLAEIIIRILLVLLFLYTEKLQPFIRIIQTEEWYLYNYPHVEHTAVPTRSLYTIVILTPIITILLFSGILKSRRYNDFTHAMLSSSLAFALNGIITNMIKVSYGRPRPDFFKRCFPSGTPMGQPSVNNLVCTGDPSLITEGRKSFPSGHSSYAFVTAGFCSLYICGKLHLFNGKGRGYSIRLLFALLPLCGAVLIAISRTCDYRHHWQDVIVGSSIGSAIAWICYFQYYPKLTDNHCNVPLWKQCTNTLTTNGEETSLMFEDPVAVVTGDNSKRQV